MFSHSFQNFLCRKRCRVSVLSLTTVVPSLGMGQSFSCRFGYRMKAWGVTVRPRHRRRWQTGLVGRLWYAGCCDGLWYQVRLLIVPPSSLLHLTPVKTEIPGFAPDPVCNMQSVRSSAWMVAIDSTAFSLVDAGDGALRSTFTSPLNPVQKEHFRSSLIIPIIQFFLREPQTESCLSS